MKKVVYLMIALALVAGLAVPGFSAKAQSATAQSWTSSITYYTPSSTAGTLTVKYYQGTNEYTADPIPLSPHKAGSLFIGSTNVPEGFAGSAVLSADVPIVATYVQFAAGSESSNYGRMLYNAFKPGDAGSTFYVPTVLNKQFNSTSRVGVQNIESFDVTATLKFYPVGAANPSVTKTQDINKFASYVFSASDVGLANGFNGSLVITAKKKGDPGTDALVVASSEETFDVGRGAYAFEGVSGGSNTVYMPSAMCQYGPANQTSYFAIQNSGGSDAQVKIDYYNTSGAKVGTMPTQTIKAGNKLSRNPCTDNALNNALGSAVITSTGSPVIAIGKILADNGLVTAYVGQGEGFTSVAAPYIRWAGDPSQEWRAYVAIMNVGGGPATNIKATYYDAAGNKYTQNVATAANPLGKFIKRNTTASDAGAPGDFGIKPVFGGAVEITSDQPIVVVARLARNVSLGSVTQFGEDYNGVDISAP